MPRRSAGILRASKKTPSPRCGPVPSYAGASVSDPTRPLEATTAAAMQDFYDDASRRAYYQGKRFVVVPGVFSNGMAYERDCATGSFVKVADPVVLSRKQQPSGCRRRRYRHRGCGYGRPFSSSSSSSSGSSSPSGSDSEAGVGGRASPFVSGTDFRPPHMSTHLHSRPAYGSSRGRGYNRGYSSSPGSLSSSSSSSSGGSSSSESEDSSSVGGALRCNFCRSRGCGGTCRGPILGGQSGQCKRDKSTWRAKVRSAVEQGHRGQCRTPAQYEINGPANSNSDSDNIDDAPFCDTDDEDNAGNGGVNRGYGAGLAGPMGVMRRQQNMLGAVNGAGYCRPHQPERNPTPAVPLQPCQRKRGVPPERVTRGYTVPPKRDIPDPTPRAYKVLYYDEFGSIKVGYKPCVRKGVMWSYYAIDVSQSTQNEGNDVYYADDGRQYVDSNNGLVMDSTVFTNTWPPATVANPQVDNVGYVDRYKTMITHVNKYRAPADGEIYFESKMAAVASGVGANTPSEDPADLSRNEAYNSDFISDDDADMRLAHAAIVVHNEDDGIHLRAAHTNDNIYAHWEVSPIHRRAVAAAFPRGAFAGQQFLVRRNRVNPMSDYKRTGIAVEPKRNCAHFYINDARIFTTNALGVPPLQDSTIYQFYGENKEITPKHYQLSLAHLTFVDGMPPPSQILKGAWGEASALNLTTYASYFLTLRGPHDDRPFQAVAVGNPLNARIWGQGILSAYQYAKVELRK